MSWKKTAAEVLADLLRLSIRVCLFIDGIMLALFTIWFCFKGLYFTINWLNQSLFGSPW